MPENATRTARVRGALLGLACGDALGAPFEGQPSVPAGDVAAWAAAAGRLRVTDDTVLALVLAEHLAARAARVDQHAPNTVGDFCFEVTLGYRRVERGR